jgi:hypothetical protein
MMVPGSHHIGRPPPPVVLVLPDRFAHGVAGAGDRVPALAGGQAPGGYPRLDARGGARHHPLAPRATEAPGPPCRARVRPGHLASGHLSLFLLSLRLFLSLASLMCTGTIHSRRELQKLLDLHVEHGCVRVRDGLSLSLLSRLTRSLLPPPLSSLFLLLLLLGCKFSVSDHPHCPTHAYMSLFLWWRRQVCAPGGREDPQGRTQLPRGRCESVVLSIAANDPHPMTWCCIQSLCIHSGEGHYRENPVISLRQYPYRTRVLYFEQR